MSHSAVEGLSGRLTDHVSVGLLAAAVPRVVIDDAVAEFGRGAKRADAKLPAHVMVYFAMAMALFADEDYQEVLTRLTEVLKDWGRWDAGWECPGSGGITQARKRLGSDVVREVFEQVAQPVAGMLTRGAWLAGRRMVSIDGFEWDVPDSAANAGYFGYAGSGGNRSAFPKMRVVTLVECGSRAPIGADAGPCGGKGSGEQSAARRLYRFLDQDMLLLADRNFYSFADWCQASQTGAELLWRLGDTIALPLVAKLGDGSYTSVVFASRTSAKVREQVLAAARAGADLEEFEDRARLVRVVEYEVADRGTAGERELFCLLTTLLDARSAPAALLAAGYHERWEHEQANAQAKTVLRGPGKVMRSQSPDMVIQELYGYLLTHYAINSLICRAATEADIDPDRVKFTNAVRIIRRRIDDPAAFSP
ncbi:IS4 family transposase [Actinospica robiniae]|uniref:IS4 family transposase n=1 Tax=Actinospica robiniae TaxID=304901 RepID=UPI000557D66D|nr:IS4 family transposase [Actinospica robiniae]